MSGILNKDSLTGEELQVLARAILLELGKDGGSNDSVAGGGRGAPTGYSGEERDNLNSRIYEVIKRLRAEEKEGGRTLAGTEGPETDRLRRAASERRLPGRFARFGLPGGSGETASASPEERRVQASAEGLEQTGLPERLSDIFSRDARRYDSPFERY